MIPKNSRPFASPRKSFLRWAGSKRQIVSTLAKYWSGECTRYVEPFAGSATLFFYLSPPQAILADINSELMATYKQVRDNMGHVLRALSELRRGRKQYYDLRKLNPLALSQSRRAARFIYLNRNCFNGIYRTNLAGEFNVPYGGVKSGRMPSSDLLIQCSRQLKKAELFADNCEVTLAKVKRGDFVYLDPPYKVNARRVFREYDSSGFSSDDVLRLRKWLLRLEHMGVPFLVSYAQCKEARVLSEGFCVEVIRVKRNISGFISGRKSAYEVLISNHKPRVDSYHL